MGNINLYKIDTDYVQDFYINLNNQYFSIGKKIIELNDTMYKIEMYYRDVKVKKRISWQWVLDEFEFKKINKISDPTSIMVIEDTINIYAITFGSAYFSADKFCDVDFAFDFIRRAELEEIKTTTLTTPNSHKNKSISTFINYDELEFESGEAFAKIKAKIKMKDNSSIFKGPIEIGHSIKTNIKKEEIANVIKFIDFVKEVIAKEEINNIPLFNIVRDKKLIEELEEELVENLDYKSDKVVISELEIIGTTEVFNTSDDVYEIKFGRHKPIEVDGINNDDIIKYLKENSLDLKENFLNVNVSRIVDGAVYDRKKVIEMIDYTDDKKMCVLLGGKWYRYNDDYVAHLNKEISRLNVIYDEELDFSEMRRCKYIEDKFNQVKNTTEYLGMSEDDIKKKLNNEYYAEAAFNNFLGDTRDYQVYDKKFYKVDKATVEMMDLYKDGTMFCVKKGNASSKLCYVVDQALNALEAYNKGLIKDVPPIHKVVIWLILERKTKLVKNEKGQPNICKLNMIGLKNKIVQWSHKARVMGYEPIIYINYWND